jgi:hypothetical protein
MSCQHLLLKKFGANFFPSPKREVTLQALVRAQFAMEMSGLSMAKRFGQQALTIQSLEF